MENEQIELSLDEEEAMAKQRLADIQEKIKARAQEQRNAALAPVLAAIKAHGFTARELGLEYSANAAKGDAAIQKTTRVSIEPKYCDPDSGATWVGRGKTPAWMTAQLANGKTKEDFLIVKPAPTYDVLQGLNVAPADAQPSASGHAENQEYGLAG